MMFSAGMGIGLMFYGVSEPLSHFTRVEAAVIEGVSAHGDDFSLVVSGNGRDATSPTPEPRE